MLVKHTHNKSKYRMTSAYTYVKYFNNHACFSYICVFDRREMKIHQFMTVIIQTQ